MNHPTPKQVTALRKKVQKLFGIGITAAQDWCAEKVYVARRTWQQWETDEGSPSHRKMPKAAWELVNIRLREAENDLLCEFRR